MEALGESHDACLQDVRSRITTEKALLENKNKEFQQIHEQLLKDGDRKLISPESINAIKELTELQKAVILVLSSPSTTLIFICQEGICVYQSK